MQLFELLVLFFLGPLFSNAQFNNFMSQMLNGGTGSASATTGSDGCSGASVSCLPAPWCRRTTDDRGCNKCDCGRLGNTQEKSNGTSPVTGHRQQAAPQSFSSFISMLKGAHGPGNSANSGAGFQSMSGMHPGFGGSQMGPMNPMASMFGTNSMFGGGGLSGGVPNIPHGPVDTSGTGSECGTAPFTCMAPPPWCQRLVNSKGCVKCYCGQELTKFLQTLNAITDKPELTSHSSESTVDTSTGTTLSAILRSTKSVTMTTARPPLGKPCLATFMCTLSCDTGYQTDDSACPVCACMDDHVILSHDQTTVADLPPVVQSSTPVQKNGIIMCPGIFDCDTVCMTGYQTDANGCPICQCEND